MWKRNVHLLGLVLGTLLADAVFVDPVFAQGKAPPAAPPGNLLQQVKWLKLEVAQGRIVARGDRCSQSRLSTETSASGQVRQTLNLETQAASLIVRYDQFDADARLTLELTERGQLSIVRTPNEPGSSPEVSYVQPPCGKVKLTIGNPAVQTISADDLWQLLLAERALCEQHLLPLLATLRPNWRLEEQLDEVERSLVSRAGADVLAQRRQWQAWMDELASPDFARRQAADRALRHVGQPLLAYLGGLDLRSLDGEQRRRVRTIMADLPDGSPDSPLRVSDWLIGDKRVWLALLGRGELEQRVAAADHLGKLCRRPLSFDPEATAEARHAQLAELTAKLADK